MAKAKKLPSGNWRVNLYIGKENGKRKYKSFTAQTAKEAEFMALEYDLLKKEQSEPANMTVGEAIDNYIENRDAVLSPTTVREYKQERANCLQSIMDIKLKDLTRDNVQSAVNKEAKKKSPKTVRNAHCLLAAALREYYPHFKLNTKLPQKKKTDITIPEEKDVAKLLNASKDTEMELPILLAVALGLRRSEICGLKWRDVDFKHETITICGAVVRGENNEHKYKLPKSYAGTRIIPLPNDLKQKLMEMKSCNNDTQDDFIVKINGDNIYNKFTRLLKTLGIKHFRFHDLRHFNASVMLSLNVPNKYAAQRMGHSTDDMLKKVYQHLLNSKIDETTNLINAYFDAFKEVEEQVEKENSGACNTKCNMEEETA